MYLSLLRKNKFRYFKESKNLLQNLHIIKGVLKNDPSKLIFVIPNYSEILKTNYTVRMWEYNVKNVHTN